MPTHGSVEFFAALLDADTSEVAGLFVARRRGIETATVIGDGHPQASLLHLQREVDMTRVSVFQRIGHGFPSDHPQMMHGARRQRRQDGASLQCESGFATRGMLL